MYDKLQQSEKRGISPQESVPAIGFAPLPTTQKQNKFCKPCESKATGVFVMKVKQSYKCLCYELKNKTSSVFVMN